MTSTSRNSSLVRFALLCVLALCATVMVACGGGSGTVGIATGTALFTTAPSAITIAAGSSGAGSFNIGGGKPTYTATSSNAGVATVTITGNGATLNINGVAAGTANVRVFDATGASVSIDVTVSQAASPAINVLPNGATGNVGDVLQFVVSGGSPGYTVNVNNPNIATVAPAVVAAGGGTFSATLVNVGSTIVTIVDSRGQTTSLTITVSQSSNLLRMSPSVLLVGENSIAPIDLNIYSGTGPYRAFTSDQTVSMVSVAGSTLTVSVGPNGNRCINPVTSDGTYVIGGTYDVTITVLDSLGASATSIMTIKDNGAGLGLGCP